MTWDSRDAIQDGVKAGMTGRSSSVARTCRDHYNKRAGTVNEQRIRTKSNHLILTGSRYLQLTLAIYDFERSPTIA